MLSKPAPLLSKTTPLRLVSFGTFACFVAWLAFACYAVAALVSH
jgi:hypothetical protein